MSALRSTVSSETRSPVWTATVSSVWSRRPVQALRSGAVSSAWISGRVRKVTTGRSVRFAGIDSTRAISAATRNARLAAVRSLFQMGEEATDRCGVQVVEVQPGRRLAGAVGDVGQQQPESVPISGHGVWAGPPLADQVLREERLQGRRERGHDGYPRNSSIRWPASSSSSGQADRYQLFRGRNNWYYSDSRVIPMPAP